MKKTLIERLVEPGAITVQFQPILDIRKERPQICGVEALSRGPKGTTLEAPDILFEYARRKHEESRVDRAAIVAILEQARRLPADLPLHVNVHASTVGRDTGFVEFLEHLCAASGIALGRLTLEILEHSNFVEEAPYLGAIEEIRHAGARVALDDVGVGASNFRMILLTRPSTLKIDRYLVRGIAGDPYQQATLRAICLLADQVGAEVIAEGVESEADLAALRSLGVERAQGYLFARPLDVDDLLAMLSAQAATARPRLTLVRGAG